MKVRDLMRSPVHSCSSKDTADRALNLMWEHDVGSIVVIDSEAGLVGVITDRDIAMAAYLQGLPLDSMTVASSIVTCRETARAAATRLVGPSLAAR